MSDASPPPDLEISDSPPTGLRVTVEQPYRILVVGDFAGSSDAALAGPLNERIVQVTADTFDAVLAEAAPSVRLTLADPVAAGSEMAAVDLRFGSVRDFDPRGLARQVPAARSLLHIREQLVARIRGKVSAEQCSQAVIAATAADPGLAWLPEALQRRPADAPTPPPAPGTVESLLSQLDLGDGSPATPAPRSPIAAIVAAASGAGAAVPSDEAAALRRTVAEIDRRISCWLTAVLHAPQIQALEAAWRSLGFLVAHTDFRKGVQVYLLHAPRADLPGRLRTLLIDPIFDEGADAPDLLVVDAQLTNTAADMEVADEVAQHAASIPAVAMAGVGAGFFGVKFAWQVPTLPALISHFDQWQFAKYKALRNQPYAPFLGLVFGRGLLRPPYGREEAADLEFRYQEPCMTDKDLVWASGAIGAACTVARSIADTGWPTAMAGQFFGKVAGFATAAGGAKGEKSFGPSDVLLPETRFGEMAAVGLNALTAPRGMAEAIFWNGLTVARPRRAEAQAMLEVSLAYQLFAIRMSMLLYALKPHLAGMALEQISSFVTQHVQSWVHVEDGSPPAQVVVQAQPAEDNPTGLDLAVIVTPPARILPGGIPVALGLRVR